MENKTDNLNPEKSLEIIASMIHQVKGQCKSNAIHFLFWGWVVVIGNIGMYTLIHFNYPDPHLIWLITFPAAFISAYLGYKQSRESKVKTHLATIYMWLWITYGIVIFTFIFFGEKVNYQINPIILLITSIPTLLSGITLRFKPLIIGGVLFWIFSMICFNMNYENQLLVAALAIVCGYLIPGYMLRNKKED